MTETINRLEPVDIEIYRGAPLPFVFFEDEVDTGTPIARDPTITMTVTPKGAASFTLAVGSGITLSTYNAVANAKVTILLSNAQSLQVPEGKHCVYEITEGPTGNKVVVMAGSLIGWTKPK